MRDPHVAVHGSFSFMVNFHAVKVYVSNRGGFSLATPFLDGFKCAAFLVGFGEDELPELQYAWKDTMDTFGPDNFSTLQRCIKVCACSLALGWDGRGMWMCVYVRTCVRVHVCTCVRVHVCVCTCVRAACPLLWTLVSA